MRKVLVAAAVGLALVAGQAAASNAGSATLQVGDRVGARMEAESEFLGLPLPLLFLGGALLIFTVTEIVDDSSSR